MYARKILILTAAMFGAAVLAHSGPYAAPEVRRTTPSGGDSRTETLKDHIIAKEREGLDALKTGDLPRFAALTADDAVFVDDHGPATKPEIVSHTAEFHLIEYAMDDVRFVPISRDSGLITYKIVEKGTSHGHEFSATVYVSALWAQRNGRWVCLFSQETTARPPRP